MGVGAGWDRAMCGWAVVPVQMKKSQRGSAVQCPLWMRLVWLVVQMQRKMEWVGWLLHRLLYAWRVRHGGLLVHPHGLKVLPQLKTGVHLLPRLLQLPYGVAPVLQTGPVQSP